MFFEKLGVTLPFLADQLHRQKSPDRLFGGDHSRTGQINLAQNPPQIISPNIYRSQWQFV